MYAGCGIWPRSDGACCFSGLSTGSRERDVLSSFYCEMEARLFLRPIFGGCTYYVVVFLELGPKCRS